MKRESIGVGLLGLGVVAGQVARGLLDRGEALSKSIGCPIQLRKIKVLPADLQRPIAGQIDPGLFTTDTDEFFSLPDVDIVIELIGGEFPALDYVRKALSSGRHVVTANKEVIAKHGAELEALAQKHNVGLRYEASAGGGIPLIAPIKRDLVANRIDGIYAIINGTTNYILTRMAKEGTSFSAALKNAQELGFAEANPENDIEGIDAVYKLAILASLAFHSPVRPEDIYREGISRMTSRDFQYAQELGFAIKLLAIAKQYDNSIEARVHPVLIPQDSLLAKVEGVNNGILVDGDLVGEVLFYGQGAGGVPTSSAVLSDVTAAAHDILHGAGTRWSVQPGKVIKHMSEIMTSFYLRMNVADRPGVLAQISRVLGDHEISIYYVLQKMTDKVAGTAEIVIMTHPAVEASMKDALEEVARLSTVKEISNFIRVEE